MRQPKPALKEFEAALEEAPNRLRGYYGAARAAQLAGDKAKARAYYAKLAELGVSADGARPELEQAHMFFTAK